VRVAIARDGRAAPPPAPSACLFRQPARGPMPMTRTAFVDITGISPSRRPTRKPAPGVSSATTRRRPVRSGINPSFLEIGNAFPFGKSRQGIAAEKADLVPRDFSLEM
jgi:hypothetical protein